MSVWEPFALLRVNSPVVATRGAVASTARSHTWRRGRVSGPRLRPPDESTDHLPRRRLGGRAPRWSSPRLSAYGLLLTAYCARAGGRRSGRTASGGGARLGGLGAWGGKGIIRDARLEDSARVGSLGLRKEVRLNWGWKKERGDCHRAQPPAPREVLGAIAISPAADWRAGYPAVCLLLPADCRLHRRRDKRYC